MAATVEIDEQNGRSDSPTLTHNIANSNMGSADSPNLDPTKAPISPGQNTCEKWQLLHVTNMGTSTKISNLKVWRSGGLGTGAIHLTNAATSTTYAGAATYTTPTTALSPIATHIMPISAPATPNLGVSGTLTGSLVKSGYSDFLVHQIQTDKKALSGSTSFVNYEYDETV